MIKTYLINWFLNLFPVYRQTVLELETLRATHENFLAHRQKVSRIGGMNTTQVEELKNFYLQKMGRLPGDENQTIKASLDDASNFNDLARAVYADKVKGKLN